jgi:2-polyprenyl-3-methyl-5-hydroxy-6-metoxy-1,4-benzoquinol methylase
MVKKIDNEINYKWESANHHTPKIENALSKILNNPIYKSLNHLDVGCGNGALTVKFYKHFNKTLGIDLSEDGIKFAKKFENEKIKFEHESIENLIKNKNKFDFITAIEVIEHQYDPLDFVQKLEQITEKEGYILISTPFHGYFKNLLISLLNLNDSHYTALWKHGHIKFFSVKTFKKLISSSCRNLEIKKIGYSGRFYPFSHSMIFLIKKN